MDPRKCLALMEILSSDSSDEEEIDVVLESLINRNSLPKISNFMETIDLFSDEQFKRHFRLAKPTFCKLLSMFEDSKYFPTRALGGKEPKSAKIHLLSFLWFAGNKSAMRTVAMLFNMSISTMSAVIDRMSNFLSEISPNIIKFPTSNEELQHIADEFENIAGFPGVVGCIDGTYITIKTPRHKIKSTYCNRHHTISLTMQAICDSNKMFLDVFTGTPGKLHDSRVFSLSFIHGTILNLTYNYHLLGDSAYPLSEQVLTPYRDYGNLTNPQRSYNHKFSATRVKIENAFGLLKGRFRQLLHIDFLTVEKSCKLIIACCVLHNMCIENNDFMEDLVDNEDGQQLDAEVLTRNESRRRGEIKRDVICHRLV